MFGAFLFLNVMLCMLSKALIIIIANCSKGIGEIEGRHRVGDLL
jgi:hypothetical protein